MKMRWVKVKRGKDPNMKPGAIVRSTHMINRGCIGVLNFESKSVYWIDWKPGAPHPNTNDYAAGNLERLSVSKPTRKVRDLGVTGKIILNDGGRI